MKALIVSLALVEVADHEEAVTLAHAVDVRSRVDVARILAAHAPDASEAELGLLGFGTTAMIVDLDGL